MGDERSLMVEQLDEDAFSGYLVQNHSRQRHKIAYVQHDLCWRALDSIHGGPLQQEGAGQSVTAVDSGHERTYSHLTDDRQSRGFKLPSGCTSPCVANVPALGDDGAWEPHSSPSLPTREKSQTSLASFYREGKRMSSGNDVKPLQPFPSSRWKELGTAIDGVQIAVTIGVPAGDESPTPPSASLLGAAV
jgi:hypothetical protein